MTLSDVAWRVGVSWMTLYDCFDDVRVMLLVELESALHDAVAPTNSNHPILPSWQ